MIELQLMTTLGCHLCDNADLLLRRSKFADEIVLERVEITEHECLLARYAEIIPVLVEPLSQQELVWPFSIIELDSYLLRLQVGDRAQKGSTVKK